MVGLIFNCHSNEELVGSPITCTHTHSGTRARATTGWKLSRRSVAQLSIKLGGPAQRETGPIWNQLPWQPSGTDMGKLRPPGHKRPVGLFNPARRTRPRYVIKYDFIVKTPQSFYLAVIPIFPQQMADPKTLTLECDALRLLSSFCRFALSALQ